jgi:hypothetical protein
MKRIITIFLAVVLVLTLGLVMATPAAAATQNAVYDSHSGNISLTGGTIAECVAAPGDGKFVQLDVGSWIKLKFPGNWAAVPDGTAAADLRVDIYDALYPASAEIFVSLNGSTWTSVGIHSDTANIDLDLEGTGPVKWVKVDQNAHPIDPAYPTLGFDLDAVVALNAGIIPYGSITSPTEGQVFFGGTVSFNAIYWDDDLDPVSWAVRRGTDAPATNTVWGNVDGHNDPYTWDGHLFHSSADVSSWTPGWYYAFVWNPSEDAGEPNIRLVRGFYIAELSNLSPPEAFNLIDTQHTVTVSIGVPVAGVQVWFDIEGPNQSESGSATTNASGVASFTYTGTSAGKDTIRAYIDQGATGYQEGEPTTDTVVKYWFQENFLTGGGTIKDANGKKVLWTIAGNIGFLPDGSIVGNFNIVDHANKNQYKAHNTFTALAFSGDSTFSPPASYNIATFTGTFTDKNGTKVELTLTITDNDESGGGADTVAVTGGPTIGPTTLSGGNFQVHDGFKG